MIKLAPVNKHPEFKDSFLTQLQVNYFDEYHPQCGQVCKISTLIPQTFCLQNKILLSITGPRSAN